MYIDGDTTLNVIEKLKLLYPEYEIHITVGHNTYKTINVKCSIHGEFTGDLHEALKGNLICPKCNNIELPDYDSVISVFNSRYSEAQLKSTDIAKYRNILGTLQNNTCPLCHNILDNPVLDHWHTKLNRGNGKVRMVLCRGCNSMLGKIENALPRNKIPYSLAPNWLRNAADYLLRDTTNLTHPTEKVHSKITKTEFKQLAELSKIDGIAFKWSYPRLGILRGKLLELYLRYRSRMKGLK